MFGANFFRNFQKKILPWEGDGKKIPAPLGGEKKNSTLTQTSYPCGNLMVRPLALAGLKLMIWLPGVMHCSTRPHRKYLLVKTSLIVSQKKQNKTKQCKTKQNKK